MWYIMQLSKSNAAKQEYIMQLSKSRLHIYSSILHKSHINHTWYMTPLKLL